MTLGMNWQIFALILEGQVLIRIHTAKVSFSKQLLFDMSEAFTNTEQCIQAGISQGTNIWT